MSLVRAIARSELADLTLVSYGGPDGAALRAGQGPQVIYGFVSLDSIPLEPHFRKARQRGEIEVMELDEGMFQLGLVPPPGASPSSPPAPARLDVMRVNPHCARCSRPTTSTTPRGSPCLP